MTEISLHSDLDFNATILPLDLNLDLITIFANITIPVYNDGVPEDEEGFVVLFDVLEDKLDSDDVGFVDILTPILLVRLVEGGE